MIKQNPVAMIRRHLTAIEIALLSVVISTITATTIYYTSLATGVGVGLYFIVGAALLHRDKSATIHTHDEPPYRPSVPPLEWTVAILIGTPAAVLSFPYLVWLSVGALIIAIGWPSDQLVNSLAGPTLPAEMGLALGLNIVAYAIHVIFSWAVWMPAEPQTVWGRLMERVAGSHLTTLGLVLLAARPLITPAAALFIVVVEVGYVYFVSAFWITEKLAGWVINRVQTWRAA